MSTIKITFNAGIDEWDDLRETWDLLMPASPNASALARTSDETDAALRARLTGQSGRCDPHGRVLPCSRCEDAVAHVRGLNAQGCHCFDQPQAGHMHEGDCPVVVAKRRERERDERRAREAPLVALVAAVPKGLDPIGWRAAVLAVDEEASSRDCHREDRCWAADSIDGDVITWLLAHKAEPCDLPLWTTRRKMHDAYRRAITPQGPRPQPYRHGFGQRCPRIVLDNGEG